MLIEHVFPEFMAYYFPEAHAQIDWAQGHEFKNTKLQQVVRDTELGRRLTDDALVQVTLTGVEQRWIYMHIEVLGQRNTDFAQRMFTYNYRYFDRYACPIASLVVLADDDNGSPVSDSAKGGDMDLLVFSRKIDLMPNLWVSWPGCASNSASARSTF
ncbi:MAG: hypothetical protein IPK44_21865 [Candidatus Accumulibacter sp.]|uniref:hypothetical protein n=1 Tax=Accumulibacter sp. TaxID=2053492 RepID=UPI0025869DAC|nr:hypothetical protein [Accumulibacter sp.]MBK8116965.1 hypothetical protein [Accumulibacter sp.]